MDNDYLENGLYTYATLLAGENSKTAFALYVGGGKFILGYEIKGVRQVSRITRQLAIALVMSLNTYKVMHKDPDAFDPLIKLQKKFHDSPKFIRNDKKPARVRTR